MAKVGMRHRENFNEIVGNLSRDAVQLTHPNRMAILAMNNKIFASGLEDHLEGQQPTQNPMQQVYSRPPPQVAPYVPNAPLPPQRAPIEASAAADGPPAWMGLGVTGLSRAANLGGNALGGMISGLVQSGTAVARTVQSSLQAQEAARQARQAAHATALMDHDFDFDLQSDGGDFHSVAGGSDFASIQDAQQYHEMQLRMHAQDMQDAEAKRKRDEIQMIQNVHPGNPFADGGATFALMARDTSSAAELIHSVIESQRTMYPFDGSDLTRPALPSSSTMPPIPDWWQLPPLMIEDAAPKRARVTTPPAEPSMPASSHQLVRSKIKQSTIGIPRQAATQRNKSFKKLPGRTPDEQLDYLLLKRKEKQAKKEEKQAKKEKKPKASKKQKPPRNDGMMQIDDGMLQLPPADGTNPFTLFRLGG
jgi:hypothetical protein